MNLHRFADRYRSAGKRERLSLLLSLYSPDSTKEVISNVRKNENSGRRSQVRFT